MTWFPYSAVAMTVFLGACAPMTNPEPAQQAMRQPHALSGGAYPNDDDPLGELYEDGGIYDDDVGVLDYYIIPPGL